MKNWSIQQQDQNGCWFYIAGNMLECDARRWFATYCERATFESLRLCNDRNVVAWRDVSVS